MTPFSVSSSAVASLTLASLTVTVLAAGGGAVHRVRTVLVDPVSGALSVDEHVRVRCSAPTGWAPLGDVLVAHGAGVRRAARLADSCPGALVVAMHHGNRCWLRPGAGTEAGGPVSVFEARGTGRAPGIWDRLASLAHSCLVAGLPVTDLGAAVGALESAVGGPVPTAGGPEPPAVSPVPGRPGAGPRPVYRPDAPSSRSSSRTRTASASCEPDRPAEA